VPPVRGWQPCFRQGTCGGLPTANARAAPAALPPPGGDRGLIREHADDAGAALDFLIDPFLQVCIPDLFSGGVGGGGTPTRFPGARSSVEQLCGNPLLARRPGHPSS